jgi:hypothetical protein
MDKENAPQKSKWDILFVFREVAMQNEIAAMA